MKLGWRRKVNDIRRGWGSGLADFVFLTKTFTLLQVYLLFLANHKCNSYFKNALDPFFPAYSKLQFSVRSREQFVHLHVYNCTLLQYEIIRFYVPFYV